MKELIKEVREEILHYAETINQVQKPTLVIIQVGNNAASNIYIKNKIKTCESVGIRTIVRHLDENCAADELKEIIKQFATDDSVNGIILQLPLPAHLKPYEQEFLDMIPCYKDVDGLSTESVGRLWTDNKCIKPATAVGVALLVGKLAKKDSVKIGIVGRSPLIGKPLIKMMLDQNATVTVYHSKSNCENVFKDNDIVITGIGNTSLAKYYDEHAIWIDCGIIRKDDGTICGDAGDLKHKNITPVPGGVGTLTTASIALNTAIASLCVEELKNGK